jgi:hypothetical protein
MNTHKDKGVKKHKHNWRLASVTKPFMLTQDLILKGYSMFVCECGLSKIVELK